MLFRSVNKLQKLKYNVYGVDNSRAMISACENKFSDINVQLGDVSNPMLYDKNTFTHILCTNFTLYEMKDKNQLLGNCHHWLVPNGLFIVHIVDRKNFSPIIPLGKPPIFDNPQKYSKMRINDTLIDFLDFTYKSSYNFNQIEKNIVNRKETFTDILTKNVRQNDLTMQMEDIKELLVLFHKNGFKLKTKLSMDSFDGDEFQYLYVFEAL